jgi:hypothetical protein
VAKLGETGRFTEFIRNILENVHLEDRVREGRMKKDE